MSDFFNLRMTTFTPADEKQRETKGILGKLNGTGILSCQAFDLTKHGATLHAWCNKAYSARFWDMAGDYASFVNYYQHRMQHKGVQHTMYFINDQPLAFSEAYQIPSSELAPFIPMATQQDFGIHFLMAPPRQMASQFREYKRGLSLFTLGQALANLYRTQKVTNIYAEPDRENQQACRLASTVGFRYVRDIVLPDKTAALFHLTKKNLMFFVK